jgi:hypothetical protein
MELDLNDLENRAREARSKTVPDAYFNCFVGGQELFELVQIARAYKVMETLYGLSGIHNKSEEEPQDVQPLLPSHIVRGT